MIPYSEEIYNICKGLDYDIHFLNTNLSNAIFLDICKKYTNGYSHAQLWERIEDYSSIYNPVDWDNSNINDRVSWDIVEHFFVGKDIVIFFDQTYDSAFLMLKYPYNIALILKEAISSLYITTLNTEFLVALNDHDYFIGAGLAKMWIDKLSD